MNNLMLYGKSKGAFLIKKYLPDLNIFKSLTIIKSIDEWNAVKDKFDDFIAYRIDYPIGSNHSNAISGASGFASSIPEALAKTKKQTPDGVILLMSTKEPAIPRYKNDGGFNVLFNYGVEIIIEIVGKGFDAHEITQGLAVHERYQIPWNEALFMKNRLDLLKNRFVIKSLVTPQNYAKQRANRIKFLENDCHYDISEFQKCVPEHYSLVSDKIISSILNDVIYELLKKQSELQSDRLNNFGVQGNLVHGCVQPWEIFRTERLLTKQMIKENEDFDR